MGAMKYEKLPETVEFLQVVERLRRECPWDKKQTHRSLIPYLLEEAYETIDAIEEKNEDSFREELGDLLLQVVLHAEIAAQDGKFTFEDVAKAIKDKMVRRHPDIFPGDNGPRTQKKAKTAEEQLKNWSEMKTKEKPKKSLLAGTPRAMPALQLAQRYGEIAASVNFDWPKISDVLDKVDEEYGELRAEIKRKPRRKADLEMELGDLLFTLTRLAAHLEIDAERSLKASCEKFKGRFEKVETHFRKKKQSMRETTLKELEAVWNKVK